MKPILALLLVAGFLVGMCFLVVSTTQYMHARHDLPAVPEQVLTPAAAETLAMYGPPPNPAFFVEPDPSAEIRELRNPEARANQRHRAGSPPQWSRGTK